MCVKHLDISNNEISALRDNQLAYLESIEYLNLSNNLIDSIQPFTFTDLQTLHTIDLSHNRLDSDAFVQKIDALRLLDLSANRYRSINITAFANIDEVKLIGNLWSCSWLVAELVNLTANVRDDVHFGNELAGIRKYFWGAKADLHIWTKLLFSLATLSTYIGNFYLHFLIFTCQITTRYEVLGVHPKRSFVTMIEMLNRIIRFKGTLSLFTQKSDAT